MRHEWVFDVLSDLLTYATRNDLPRLAARVSATIDEARNEIGETGDPPDEPQTPPPSGRRIH